MTIMRKGHRTIGLLGATVVLLAASACSGDGQESAPAASWVAPASSSAASADGPKRVEQITSACKLLPAAVAVKVLGGTASTKLSAKEAPVEKTGAERRYTCSYVRGDREAFSFIVQTLPDEADRARESIDNIAQASGAQTTSIDNLGTAAVTYATGGGRILAVGVTYEKELRLLVFAGPAIIPQDRLTQLAEHIVAQI